jgi:hypothetical protein
MVTWLEEVSSFIEQPTCPVGQWNCPLRLDSLPERTWMWASNHFRLAF